jgi:fluoroquinolone resistance protein
VARLRWEDGKVQRVALSVRAPAVSSGPFLLVRAKLAFVELRGEVFTDRAFDGFDAPESRQWEECRFVRCTFRQARLGELKTRACEFDECDFTGADLSSTKHLRSSFLNCNLSGANLFGSQFDNCIMVGSIFDNSRLDALRITRGNWSYVRLRMQDLKGFSFEGVVLEGADFYGSDLTGVSFRNADLRKATIAQAKLRDSDLRGAQLEGIDFREVDVEGARMTLDQAVLFAMCHGIVIE